MGQRSTSGWSARMREGRGGKEREREREEEEENRGARSVSVKINKSAQFFPCLPRRRSATCTEMSTS